MTAEKMQSVLNAIREHANSISSEEELAKSMIERRTRFAVDITRLSYWFPKIQAAGLPAPKTKIIKATDAEYIDIYRLLGRQGLKGPGHTLISRIKSAADEIGYPCFLRTDHTSGKHDWEKTCYLANPGKLIDHIANIIYFWECVNISAPPCDVWAVREFLPTMPLGVCKNYGNMPICREFRFFVNGPEVKCRHPYWPPKALEQGGAEYYDNFNWKTFTRLPAGENLHGMASLAGNAAGGEWSIDFLETKNGWFITDMAEAHKSYHWEGCPKSRYKSNSRLI